MTIVPFFFKAKNTEHFFSFSYPDIPMKSRAMGAPDSFLKSHYGRCTCARSLFSTGRRCFDSCCVHALRESLLLRNPSGAPCQSQHPWSMAQCAMRFYRVLSIKLGQPRALLWFRVRDGKNPWPVRSGEAMLSDSIINICESSAR